MGVTRTIEVLVVGGALDGDRAKLRADVEEGYMARLHTKPCTELTQAGAKCGCSQSSDYTLRVERGEMALVAQGVKWPFLDSAPA